MNEIRSKSLKRAFFVVVLCFVASTAIAQTGFWQPTNGPFGRTVFAIAVNSEGHIFGGTADSRV